MFKLKRSLILLFSLVCFSLTIYAADIYKTVDKNGQVIYTDKPLNSSSEKVEVGEPLTIPSVELRERPRTNNNRNAGPPKSYSVSINYPPNETHMNPGQFHLSIQVSTNPSVHDSHQLVVLDNGTIIPNTDIEYISPGSHRFEAQVVDQRGKVISSSESVMVYVHRANLNNRPKQTENTSQ